MIFLGCDPGLSGALAVWNSDAKTLAVHDMPTLRVKPNSAKRTLDVVELARIADCVAQGAALAVIEQASTRPKQAAGATLQQGANWGVAYMALVAQFIPVEIAPAHVWKRAMGVTAAKDSSLARIKQQLPQHAVLFARKCDDGRAEAALLALYAERRFREQGVTL